MWMWIPSECKVSCGARRKSIDLCILNYTSSLTIHNRIQWEAFEEALCTPPGAPLKIFIHISFLFAA